MGDLEELDRGQASRQELRIDPLLDVAGQQEAVRSEGAEEDDRDVVDAGAAVRWVLRHPTGIGP
jgi:hypothetical protein